MKSWIENHPFTIWFIASWITLVFLTGSSGF